MSDLCPVGLVSEKSLSLPWPRESLLFMTWTIALGFNALSLHSSRILLSSESTEGEGWSYRFRCDFDCFTLLTIEWNELPITQWTEADRSKRLRMRFLVSIMDPWSIDHMTKFNWSAVKQRPRWNWIKSVIFNHRGLTSLISNPEVY